MTFIGGTCHSLSTIDHDLPAPLTIARHQSVMVIEVWLRPISTMIHLFTYLGKRLTNLIFFNPQICTQICTDRSIDIGLNKIYLESWHVNRKSMRLFELSGNWVICTTHMHLALIRILNSLVPKRVLLRSP